MSAAVRTPSEKRCTGVTTVMCSQHISNIYQWLASCCERLYIKEHFVTSKNTTRLDSHSTASVNIEHHHFTSKSLIGIANMGHETTAMTIPNSLKEKILRGEVAYTLSVKMVRTVELPMIAKTAGFDGILIDMEHSSFDLDTTSQLCIAALYAGIAPIVRSPTKEPFFVSRILDGGAVGVIVPHIKTVRDAEEVVEAAKFHPLGKRSATSGLPHLQYRHVPAKVANPICNDATLVIPMIETLEALEDVDAIAAVPGIDSLLIGTNDLTAEMGIPGDYENPRLTAAYEKVGAACRRNNIFLGCGGLHSRLDLVEKFCEFGVDWVMAATDAPLLIAGATKRASEMSALNQRVKSSRMSENGHDKGAGAAQRNGVEKVLNGQSEGLTNGVH